MMGKIYVVGIGPGNNDQMTPMARAAIEGCDTVIGYPVYIELVKDLCTDKEVLSTPMKKEVERCRMCFDEAAKGKTVALVCSGDAGVYGMASLVLELSEEYEKCEIEIVPGITAAISGAAVLGAPLNHDFCVISLSDLLTPWELIEKRLIAAMQGDLAVALYNPSSKKRHDYLKKACEIMLSIADEDRACGYVRNIGREGTESRVCTLGELQDAEVNMFTTVFIGNSQTRIIDGRLVTPRGYFK